MKLLVVTGCSGAGKGGVKHELSDMGYRCVDNLPAELIPALAKTVGEDRIAVISDIRDGEDIPERLIAAMDELPALGIDCRILYVDSTPEFIIKRYKETRRPHPVHAEGRSLIQCYEYERSLLAPLFERAAYRVMPLGCSARELRAKLAGLLDETTVMRVGISSFGFKNGLPQDADMVFDARFLPNPFYLPELKTQTGEDEAVVEFLRRDSRYEEFIKRLDLLLELVLPGFESEGRASVNIAIGCTGGMHRSVAVASTLAASQKSRGRSVYLTHRDMKESQKLLKEIKPSEGQVIDGVED